MLDLVTCYQIFLMRASHIKKAIVSSDTQINSKNNSIASSIMMKINTNEIKYPTHKQFMNLLAVSRTKRIYIDP